MSYEQNKVERYECAACGESFHLKLAKEYHYLRNHE